MEMNDKWTVGLFCSRTYMHVLVCCVKVPKCIYFLCIFYRNKCWLKWMKNLELEIWYKVLWNKRFLSVQYHLMYGAWMYGRCCLVAHNHSTFFVVGVYDTLPILILEWNNKIGLNKSTCTSLGRH